MPLSWKQMSLSFDVNTIASITFDPLIVVLVRSITIVNFFVKI